MGAALFSPAVAAAQAAGVKPGDLPDFTIKEVKVYVADLKDTHKYNSTETGEIVSIVTHDGIEGNYTLGNRARTENWLAWAKPNLTGKNMLELLPAITATSGMKSTSGFGGPRQRPAPPAMPTPNQLSAGPSYDNPMRGGGTWPNYYTASAEICFWDILGKALNLPLYKILGGGSKDRLVAYASSRHLPAIEDYVPDVLKAKAQGFKAYKIHPGRGQHAKGVAIPVYIGHMEIIREIRKAVGDEFVLAHDPVQNYNRYEAMAVGRLLDELNYAWYEDPIRSIDADGLVELCAALTLPIHVGEFLYSVADFAEYIRRGALDVVRLIADNAGGISGSMRLGLLADAFGLECTPHNWGNVLDLAVHFHIELALPNAYWFEMPFPGEWTDRPYHQDTFRLDEEGNVKAPTKAGLGSPIDRDGLDKILKRIDR
jgi:L-alanine-DL-glutamate epimerase-like enolase superfamily enzyme